MTIIPSSYRVNGVSHCHRVIETVIIIPSSYRVNGHSRDLDPASEMARTSRKSSRATGGPATRRLIVRIPPRIPSKKRARFASPSHSLSPLSSIESESDPNITRAPTPCLDSLSGEVDPLVNVVSVTIITNVNNDLSMCYYLVVFRLH